MRTKQKTLYQPGSFEEKIERLKVRERMIQRLKTAERNNDIEEIETCNSVRELPPLPGSDDGWNVKVASIMDLYDWKEF